MQSFVSGKLFAYTSQLLHMFMNYSLRHLTVCCTPTSINAVHWSTPGSSQNQERTNSLSPEAIYLGNFHFVLLTHQVSLVFSGSSSRSDDRGSNPASTTGGHLRSRVRQGALIGTSALCDAGTHQPEVALDCLLPSDQAVISSAQLLKSYLLADFIER